MALGTGSHWEAPILGSDRAQGGLCEEVPILVQSSRFRAVYFRDFVDNMEFTPGSNWTATNIGATGVAATETTSANGILRLTSGAVDNAGLGSVQQNIVNWLPTTADSADGLNNRIIAFGARVAISDWSVADWFIGMGGNDATFLLATGLIATTGADNCVGFHHIAEASTQGGLLGPDLNDVRLVSAGTAVANYQATLLSAAQVPRPVPANAAVDGVFHEFGVRIVGTQDVEFYLNGVLRHRRRMGTAFAAVGIQPTFAHVCAGGADANMDIDYLWAAGTR